MNQKIAVICVGISASGKSTFAEEWMAAAPNRVRIERDAVRKAMVEAKGKKFTWKKWNWKLEGAVTAEINELIHQAAKNSQDIIISDTNLQASKRKALIARLEQFGYEVKLREFPVTIEEAWARDAARENGVGHSVIAEQYEKWLKNSGRKKYVPDLSKPKCILVDVDGTLAHMNGKRGPFDWDNVGVDDIDIQVRSIVNMFSSQTGRDFTHVIVLSGRDGVCQPQTTEWLGVNDVKYDELIMRAPGDGRKDTIVKEEIFWRDIADNYNVLFAIDDRPSVARMWREIGVKVFQVGNPHIEF